jgi:hypothetical protein
MLNLFASAPLYASAAAFCVARGLWVAFRFTRYLRANPGAEAPGPPEVDPQRARRKRHGFLFGAGLNIFVYVAGGVGVLAGLTSLRWILAAELVRVALRDIRSTAAAAAEGRKAVELAASWDYVRGRAHPRLGDYMIAIVVVAPITLLPALILALGSK